MRATSFAASVAAVLASAGAANAAIALATNGSTLYRVDLMTASVETFSISDDIVSQSVQPDGSILAYSNSSGPNGFEVYNLADPLGAAPSLSLLTDTRSSQAPTHTLADGTLYAVKGGDLFTADPVSFELTFVNDIANLGGDANIIGGSAYDPASGAFYIISRDGNLRQVNDFATPNPSASLIGSTGADAQNHGMEFFDGVLYAAIQNAAGDQLQIGSIDTSTGAFTSLASIPTNSLLPTSISVIPAPGAAALAGMAGLAAMRRRR